MRPTFLPVSPPTESIENHLIERKGSNMQRPKNGLWTRITKAGGGVSLAHHKNTAECAVVRMPPPERVILPMLQHIGVPCTPTVQVGDTVKVGQVVGDCDSPMSTPVHASVSGKVSKLTEVMLPNGRKCVAVEIQSDGEMALWEGIRPPKLDTRDDLLAAVRASGLAGLGGAGFPAHRKLDIKEEKQIDFLLINAAECEPYITVDYRECIEHTQDILDGARRLRDMLGIGSVIIAVEDNKPKAIEALNATLSSSHGDDTNIAVLALPSRYPQGAEKVLVWAATGRKIPPGKLPIDVGCLVMNAASIAFFSRYIKTGKPLVSRSVTIDGTAIAKAQNLRIPIGTPIADVIAFCGGYKATPKKLLMGGPMMGLALPDDTLPILKQNNAILAFAEEDACLPPERACIHCGRCNAACPMNLLPTALEDYARLGDAGELEKRGAMVCMECGCCAYSCPSGRPLVQYMRLAKEIVRSQKK